VSCKAQIPLRRLSPKLSRGEGRGHKSWKSAAWFVSAEVRTLSQRRVMEFGLMQWRIWDSSVRHGQRGARAYNRSQRSLQRRQNAKPLVKRSGGLSPYTDAETLFAFERLINGNNLHIFWHLETQKITSRCQNVRCVDFRCRNVYCHVIL